MDNYKFIIEFNDGNSSVHLRNTFKDAQDFIAKLADDVYTVAGLLDAHISQEVKDNAKI